MLLRFGKMIQLADAISQTSASLLVKQILRKKIDYGMTRPNAARV